jgi:hypothetical protein
MTHVKGFLLGSFFVLTAYLFASGNWRTTRFPIQMDANGYYIYLPAVFIYGDLEALRFVDEMPEQFDRKYFLYPGIHGGYMTKYSPGMAILELPFFGIAHAWALSTEGVADGYSPPYRLLLGISTIFYTCLGLWFLAMLMARYFSPGTVLIAIGLLLWGTNLFHYNVLQPAITHNYVFFLVCILLNRMDRWLKTDNILDFALACACVGFAALIRPTEVLVGLLVLGFFVFAWRRSDKPIRFFTAHLPQLILGALCFATFLLPVFLYWKLSTGHWVAYTYEQEGFYFDRPWQIWLGLFGFRKGWFIYTPLLFLAAWGYFGFRKESRFKAFEAALLWYMPLNLFIVLSWYGWWYGGCFGLRALIPALALAAMPLAWLIENTKQFKAVIGLGLFFVTLNLFQSFQYQRQILHMDAMTWRSYFFIFGKWKLDDAEKAQMKTMLDFPDYNQRGKKLDEYFK